MRYLLLTLKILAWTTLGVVMTYLSQVGGLILLLYWPIGKFGWRWLKKRWQRRLGRGFGFVVWWMLWVLYLIPVLAAQWGRVPLPIYKSDNLQPLNTWTALFNRNYVTPGMRNTLQDLADGMSETHPGTVIAYMDCQFPFSIPLPKAGRSLPPHITHNDGRKADIALLYADASTGKPLHRTAPTWIGYGSLVPPQAGERDRPAECGARGFRLYNLMARTIPQKEDFDLDKQRTGDFLRMVLRHPAVTKIYLEPHLVQRLQLKSAKIGLASCASVRHDDHVHIQTKE